MPGALKKSFRYSKMGLDEKKEPSSIHSVACLENKRERGAWVAQSVKRPTSAQGVISWFVSSGPASGSVLTAWSLKPASHSVSPSLSLCLSPTHVCALSQK